MSSHTRTTSKKSSSKKSSSSSKISANVAPPPKKNNYSTQRAEIVTLKPGSIKINKGTVTVSPTPLEKKDGQRQRIGFLSVYSSQHNMMVIPRVTTGDIHIDGRGILPATKKDGTPIFDRPEARATFGIPLDVENKPKKENYKGSSAEEKYKDALKLYNNRVALLKHLTEMDEYFGSDSFKKTAIGSEINEYEYATLIKQKDVKDDNGNKIGQTQIFKPKFELNDRSGTMENHTKVVHKDKENKVKNEIKSKTMDDLYETIPPNVDAAFIIKYSKIWCGKVGKQMYYGVTPVICVMQYSGGSAGGVSKTNNDLSIEDSDDGEYHHTVGKSQFDSKSESGSQASEENLTESNEASTKSGESSDNNSVSSSDGNEVSGESSNDNSENSSNSNVSEKSSKSSSEASSEASLGVESEISSEESSVEIAISPKKKGKGVEIKPPTKKQKAIPKGKTGEKKPVKKATTTKALPKGKTTSKKGRK
jgi:hypothetical protein